MVSVCCDQITVSIDLESTVSGILYTCLTGFVSKCNGKKAFSTDSQVGRIVSHLKAALIPVGICLTEMHSVCHAAQIFVQSVV